VLVFRWGLVWPEIDHVLCNPMAMGHRRLLPVGALVFVDLCQLNQIDPSIWYVETLDAIYSEHINEQTVPINLKSTRTSSPVTHIFEGFARHSQVQQMRSWAENIAR